MSIVKKFNGLNGSCVNRPAIQLMIAEARNQEQTAVAERLERVLAANPKDKKFNFIVKDPAIEIVPESVLCSLEQEDHDHEQAYGLGKAVSPDEIYTYVTDLIINTIEKVGHLPWQKEWVGSGDGREARNYVTKRPYSGINFVLLNFDIKKGSDGKSYLVPVDFDQPYYLTMNQIKDAGAVLKKGSKAHRVVYYTMILNYKSDSHDFKGSDSKKFETFVKEHGITSQDMSKHLQRIPVLKYYNVFRADDCTGLTFPKAIANKVVEPIAACQAIIDYYKNPPKYTYVGSDAKYIPAKDILNMPKIEAFKFEAAYYSTFFHEIVHSTGHQKRLDRGFTGKTSKKDYAYEELIAELGAVFLCSQSGILFQTRDNSAKYLAGWNSRLTSELESDNRFFLKAAAQSQKATNLILDPDAAGNPKYLQVAAKAAKKVKPVKKAVRKTATKVKSIDIPVTKDAIVGYAIVDPISAKIVASKKTLAQLETVYKSLERKEAFKSLSLLVYEIIEVKGKNKLGKQIDADFDKPTEVDKKDLDAANPKSFATKPKSVSEASAITDILTLPAYKGINQQQAQILYKYFKDNMTSEDYVPLTSKYEQGIMGRNSKFYHEWENEISLLDNGTKLLEAIKGRIESKVKQKHNYTLFDGLKGSFDTSEINEPVEVKPQINKPNNPRVNKIGCSNDAPAEFYTVDGEIGKFLQQVERKSVGSVVITLDGEPGAGKTTTLYHFMQDFASPGNKCLFISGEEDPKSFLVKDKVNKYLSTDAQANIDIIDGVNDIPDLYDVVQDYDIIFLDSWQKLQEMVGTIHLDKDVRKKIHGKVFVVIFQQTTEGKTKGGANVVFDGDIIIKMVNHPQFADNYAYFYKHRYTLVPKERLRYNIANGTVYDPEAKAEPEPEQVIEAAPQAKPQLLFKEVV